MTIFVQIAAYRDEQLVPTIGDLLRKARYPGQLRIGICRQYHPHDRFDNLDVFKKDGRFRIVEVPYSQSKGACWARNITQRLYMGEDYTLQIDSHMRFARHWDVILTGMVGGLQAKGFAKPLLTGYMAAFDPADPASVDANDPPLYMAFDSFGPEGAPVFSSAVIPGWQKMVHPVPARFYSAGFCFTLGRFCREVQHDPAFYFLGEEISITVRAFTHGYDLFHPHRNLVWHYYGRKKSRRQWDDDRGWYQKDKQSLARNRVLLGMERGRVEFGRYGLGKVRLLRDYERYAGILFSRRAVQKYTLDQLPPPNPRVPGGEEQWLRTFLVQG
jgi:glycosyltransferase involved in cell wall biosynthesis